jgi:aspartyl-tRNA synthetase
MRNRTLIKDLAASQDGPVVLGGWVEKLRDQKRIQFVILRDESGDVQVTYPRPVVDDQPDENDALAAKISTLTAGSFIWVHGRLVHDERVKLGGLEIQLDDIEIVTLADPISPIADDTSIDKRLDWRFLDLRRTEMNLVFQIQTTIEQAWREWWTANNFVEIHSPKLMASASESNAELFKLEYFETHAYLAQSPQFYKQMAMMAGFGRIFEIGPVFRIVFVTSHQAHFIHQAPTMPEYLPVALSKRAGEDALRAKIPSLKEKGIDFVVVSGDMIEGTVTATLLDRVNPGAIESRKAAVGKLYNVEEFAEEIFKAANSPVPENNTVLIGDTDWFENQAG